MSLDIELNYNLRNNRFCDFILKEAKTDDAYNEQMSKKIIAEIRDMMGEIYIPTISANKAKNKIQLIRRGQGGAYQFEIKINNDGTFSVCDNSNARGFIRIQDDGSKKFVLINAKTFYTTTKINYSGIMELMEWLIDNYDKYSPINVAAKDRQNGILQTRTSDRDPLARKRGQPKRVTQASQALGGMSASEFLAAGHTARELAELLSRNK